MEVFWILGGAILVLGPWVLGIVALVRANGAVAEARRATASASAAWRAARPIEQPLEAPPPAEPRAPSPVRREGAEAPAPPLPLPAEPVQRPPPAPSLRADALEEKIALVWFTRAGALAVLLGAAYFLKYAIDNAWLGPWGRIALACLLGAAALVLGEAARARTRPIWIHGLQGAGLALLFLAGFGSHALYRLVPAGAAFAAVAAVALLGGALAVRHRAELLLALALVGGMLAPVFLSTGEDRPLALFGYLLVLGALALLVSVRLSFRVAPWLAFAGTVALAAGWYDRFFQVWPPPAVPSASLPLEEQMGRYFPLALRAVPLAAAFAFSSSWILGYARLRRAAPRPWSDAWLAASLLFATVAPFALVHDRPLLGGLALAGAGVLAARLLPAAGRAVLVVPAEAVAFGLLWLAIEGRRSGEDGWWIAAAALPSLAHLGAVARAWLLRAEPPTPARTAAAAVAGLGFAAFAVALTRPDQGVLRAALVGAAGAAELALGAASVASARSRASVLLGTSLALLAGAAAFLFSGATVTVAWAAMAAVAAVLGARERDRWWIAGACVLFAAALGRVAFVDLPSVERAAWLFLGSAGRHGRLEPLFLVNPRAVALAATAAALLLSARAIVRATPDWRRVAGVLAAVGWALAVALAVTEARDLALTFPPPPAAGDAAAFVEFRDVVVRARIDQGGTLSAVASLVLAVCAALLVGGGFLFRDAFHRRLGLGLFVIVLGKLLLADVWRLSRLQQVAVFLGVGALLLAAAFLYARLGKRIAAALLRDGPPGGGAAALALLLAALGAAAPAHALDASPFRVARSIEDVAAPGLHAVEADADLLRASRAAPGSLADVRIEGPGGAEVPWALRAAEERPAEQAVEGTVVDPVALPDGSVRAVVDLGAVPPRHGELRLDVSGDEFLRVVRLEVSQDGHAYGLLSESERIWAIRDAPEARHTSLRHPPSEARFLRVTLLPGAGGALRITGARAALGAAGDLPLRALDVPLPAAKRSPDGRETFLEVDLGAPGLPVEAVELDVADPAFERRVRVFASTDGEHWISSGGGAVWRAPRSAGAFPASPREGAREGLRASAATGGRRWVRMAVADGDSPPLRVTGLRVLWRPREIVFRAEGAGRHTLLAGADVPAPVYDLSALLARLAGDPAPARARLGAAGPNPRFREAVKALPLSERYRGALVVGLVVLFGALAFWAVRLLRGPPRSGGEGA